ncbi:hypothetical protein FWF89_03955 [Candidatus Saccharibacteria bacterium]|nr:hypothetical protein [Candidatus Saccharibacteria bacterium]
MPNAKIPLSDYDNIIALEFGAPVNRVDYCGSVNMKIARYLMEHVVRLDTINAQRQQWIFASQSIADALFEHDFAGHVCTVSSGSATFTLKADDQRRRYDSFEHIQRAAQYILPKDNKQCLIVTQAYLAERAARQAVMFGLEPHLPENLPLEFAPESPQIWCRNKHWWRLREFVGVPYLERIGRL